MSVRRILIADDDPVLLEMGSESFRAEGYVVTAVNNGAEALAQLNREPADLAVLDIDMPHMDGLSVLRKIRTSLDGQISVMPVIMLTGRRSETDIKECYDFGATSYIAKPVSWLNMAHQIAFTLKASDDALALRKNLEMTARQSRIKDTVMMTLQHELRSPLHVIKGFSSLLTESLGNRLNDSDRMSLNLITEAVESISEKMNKLFLYSEILSGDFHLRREFTSVQRIVSRAIDNCLGLANERGVSIRLIASEQKLPEVECDEERLLICISHLLENAIKFSPESSTIVVTLSLDSADDSVCLKIEDEGEGVDETQVGKLFVPFLQGDSGLTRSSTGLGLGLTVAKSIAELHNGTLEITNREDYGACVTLTFPTGISSKTAAA